MTTNIKRKFRIREAPLMDKNMDTKIWISEIWKKMDYFWQF